MSVAVFARGACFVGHDEYQPVSDGSREIGRLWANRNHDPRVSASDWAPVIEAALAGIRNECNRAGWDGDEALPISDRTISVVAQVAGCLFTLLPRGTPAPDLVPEHDGEICMIWSISADRVFSVSVGAHGKMNFAGQFGKEGAFHAWQPIHPEGRASLEESLQDVARYVGRLHSTPAVRRAA
jgi:hypothetical protein